MAENSVIEISSGKSKEGKNKGGRPSGQTRKEKATFYLREGTDDLLREIRKNLVIHADVLIEDKGTVIDQALSLLKFGLSDPETRPIFLRMYAHWQKTQLTNTQKRTK